MALYWDSGFVKCGEKRKPHQRVRVWRGSPPNRGMHPPGSGRIVVTGHVYVQNNKDVIKALISNLCYSAVLLSQLCCSGHKHGRSGKDVIGDRLTGNFTQSYGMHVTVCPQSHLEVVSGLLILNPKPTHATMDPSDMMKWRGLILSQCAALEEHVATLVVVLGRSLVKQLQWLWLWRTPEILSPSCPQAWGNLLFFMAAAQSGGKSVAVVVPLFMLIKGHVVQCTATGIVVAEFRPNICLSKSPPLVFVPV